MIKNKFPVTKTYAQYRETQIETHKNNPLILALPERIPPSRFKDILTCIVEPNLNCINLNDDTRIAELKQFRQTKIITTQHLDLFNETYDLLIQGYIDRNPNRPEVIAWGYDIADSKINISDIQKPHLSNSVPQTTSEALFVTGISGSGKSTALDLILSLLFPMVIEHQLEHFAEPQVVYIKVDMPHNANRSALIHQILKELDRILDATSSNFGKYALSVKKLNGTFIDIASMMNILRTALVRHHVGLIVIDEFQNLQVASLRYRDEMLNLFDELSNTLAIPTIKIGTPDSILLFDKKGRHKRRIGATFELSRFTSKSDWKRAIKALFAYQPLKTPITSTENLEAVLQELTAGVPAILITLWEASLIEAIRSGKETLSAELLKNTFKKRFPLMRTVIRNINQGKKGRHIDLLTIQQHLEADNSSLALKHLEQLAKDDQLKGEAADALKNDIDQQIKLNKFSESDLKKLKEIKAELNQKRQEVRKPQTLEHEK